MILHDHERAILGRLVDQADFFAAWVNTMIANWDTGMVDVPFTNSDKNRVAQLIGAVNEARAVLKAAEL